MAEPEYYGTVDELRQGIYEAFHALTLTDYLLCYMLRRGDEVGLDEVTSLKQIIVGLSRNNETLSKELLLADLSKKFDPVMFPLPTGPLIKHGT